MCSQPSNMPTVKDDFTRDWSQRIGCLQGFSTNEWPKMRPLTPLTAKPLFELSGLLSSRQPSMLSERIQLAMKDLDLALQSLELPFPGMILYRNRRV